MKTAVQGSPRAVGLDLANWNWKVVRAFVQQQCGLTLSRSSCRNYLHRLGFVLRRPRKRLAKADAARRAAFVREYAFIQAVAAVTGAKIFFADEAHFYADVDLRGKWVLKGDSALIDSTSPRWGEKVSYYSAVCVETGEVAWREVEGNSNAETSAAFLRQLRADQTTPLIVIWDNGPAHSGDPLRDYLATPDLRLRLLRLPSYSPDDHPDEKIWGWVREEATANTCFGTKAKVREAVEAFFRRLPERTDEVKRRCRTILQREADSLAQEISDILQYPQHVDLTLALV